MALQGNSTHGLRGEPVTMLGSNETIILPNFLEHSDLVDLLPSLVFVQTLPWQVFDFSR
jgi:hypothetical protein